jgi:hypothetical protein
MSNKLHNLAMAVAGQFGLSSPLGQWILAASQQISGGGAAGGGCCIKDVVIANGQVSQFVPFPAGCEQPDTNYVVTGVMQGGTLQTFAIPAKATIGFQVAFAGVTAGGIVMDFLVTRC